MIPDTKDWTWVLRRTCPNCGFDASACVERHVASLVRANATAWRSLESTGVIRPGRPDPDRWSTLEYACHVRDVYRRYDERLALMLTASDPLFANWDQDVTAVEDDYDRQNPGDVIDELIVAARMLAAHLDEVSGDSWNRPGRRSDGTRFTVSSIARYMVHDPIHHLWDVSGQRCSSRS